MSHKKNSQNFNKIAALTNITANIFFLCGIISFKKNPANMYVSKRKNRVIG